MKRGQITKAILFLPFLMLLPNLLIAGPDEEEMYLIIALSKLT